MFCCTCLDVYFPGKTCILCMNWSLTLCLCCDLQASDSSSIMVSASKVLPPTVAEQCKVATASDRTPGEKSLSIVRAVTPPAGEKPGFSPAIIN